MKQSLIAIILLSILLSACAPVHSTAPETATETVAQTVPETTAEPATEPTTEPTLSPEELFMQSLPEKLRLPLVLYYSEGLTYAEIAQTLRLPMATVRGRIHRAKGQLRKELGAE